MPPGHGGNCRQPTRFAGISENHDDQFEDLPRVDGQKGTGKTFEGSVNFFVDVKSDRPWFAIERSRPWLARKPGGFNRVIKAT